MTKQEIINYVMNSPANTNPNVLSSLLDDVTEVSEETTILTEESVTTQTPSFPTGENPSYGMGNLVYSQIIDADAIQVTFEGRKYICQKREALNSSRVEYGASADSKTGLPDFSEFPFAIFSLTALDGKVHNTLTTEAVGTYQIKIEVPQEDSGSTSEWSTAQVSFANNGESDYNVYISHMLENSSSDFVSERITVLGSGSEGSASEATTLSVPLYQNCYFLKYSSFSAANFTGSEALGQITQTNGGFLIKGNGTILVTGGSDR